MVEAAEISGRRIVSLALGGDISSTQMPVGTGDRVIFIAEVATEPSGNPTGGGILYVKNGVLNYHGPGGTTTPIAPS